MTRFLRALALTLLAGIPADAQVAPHLPPLDRSLPPRAEKIYQQLSQSTDAKAAMDVVTFMAPLWRLAGNPAFEQSQQLIFDTLAAAGLKPRYEEFANANGGWEYTTGTVRIGGASGEIVLSREQDRVALAINSYSTPRGGAAFPLIDVGAGTSAAAYEGKAVKGAVVLASGSLGQVFTQAVRNRGAAGVISSDIAPYTRPAETPNVLQWGSIPRDAALNAFGFKATPRAAARLKAELAKGAANIHVEIASTFQRGLPPDTVINFYDVQGTDQRVVLAAHVQEPGANDNASGTAALVELAKRGVKVRVLTNSLAATDVSAVHAGYAKYREDLLRGGVHLYEMKPTARPEGGAGGSDASLHAKTFSVDRARIFVGSFNFDPRSARLNTEIGFVIDSPQLAEALAERFATSIPERAYRVRQGAHGALEWVEQTESGELVHSREPGATFWRRAWVWALEQLPIEWLL